MTVFQTTTIIFINSFTNYFYFLSFGVVLQIATIVSDLKIATIALSNNIMFEPKTNVVSDMNKSLTIYRPCVDESYIDWPITLYYLSSLNGDN